MGADLCPGADQLTAQVSNLCPCVKIATDFVSIDGLDSTLAVTEEFARLGKENALAPSIALWHAWQSLSRLEHLELHVGKDTVLGKRHRPRTIGEVEGRRRHGLKGVERDPRIFCHRCPHPECAHLVQFKMTSVSGIVDHMYVGKPYRGAVNKG